MLKEYVINVQSLECPQRLDIFLSKSELFQSRSQVQNLIKKKQIYVNGGQAKTSVQIRNGDIITILLSGNPQIIIPAQNIPLDIVYEDNDMAVVNKPKNMLTHPTIKETTGTMVNALLYKYGYEGLSDINGVMRPGIVHRLDRNTSGLLMIAKNNISHEFLAEQIKNKTAQRQYLAVVHGNFKNETGIIDEPIGRNPSAHEKMAVIPNGKPAVTLYRVLEQFNGYSFVEFTLQTGRTHQIRVHSNYTGHAVVNDGLYSKKTFKVKTCGQVLQAYKLKFTALKNNGIIELKIDLDEDLAKVLTYLRSINK